MPVALGRLVLLSVGPLVLSLINCCARQAPRDDGRIRSK